MFAVEVTCENQRCERMLGPVVDDTAVVTVGRNNYLAEELLAIECEACKKVSGEKPVANPREQKQDIRCEKCGKKCGEMYPAFMVASSGGRAIWARRFRKIHCTNRVGDDICNGITEPRYQTTSRFGVRSAPRVPFVPPVPQLTLQKV